MVIISDLINFFAGRADEHFRSPGETDFNERRYVYRLYFRRDHSH